MPRGKLLKGLCIVAGDLVCIGRREVDYYKAKPLTATLFLTYRCDSKCMTCSRWKLPQNELLDGEIALTQWLAIVDQLIAAGIGSCEIFGGNVLLRKDLLIQLLAYLHEKGIAIHLPTNQIGLDEEVAEAVIKYVDTIYVSTDGLGKQQNEIRGLEEASRNAEQAIDRLRRAREKLSDCTNRTRIVCNNTISRFNVDSMEHVAEYALATGFDEIHFEYAGEFLAEEIAASAVEGIIPDPHYVKGEQSILVDSVMAKQIKQSLKRIKKKYRGRGLVIGTINIDTRSEKSLTSGLISHGKCYVLRNEVTVDPSGNMVACPFVTNYMVGNLVLDSFASLWRGERFRSFRQIHSSGGLPMCARCILGVQRNPGLVQSLKRIYYARIEPVMLHR